MISTTAELIRPLLVESPNDPGYVPVAYITGERDFEVKMTAYFTLCDEKPDHAAIDDFPRDPQTQQDHVQQLVAAMIYLGEDCEDAQSKKSTNRVSKLSPFELNLMAWRILFDMRDCQLGHAGMPRWGKDWTVQKCLSFSERFEMVKQALRTFKASVASLFDYTFSKRLTRNPAGEIGKIRGNKAVNGSRRQDLAIAKLEKEKQNSQNGIQRSSGRGAGASSQPQQSGIRRRSRRNGRASSRAYQSEATVGALFRADEMAIAAQPQHATGVFTTLPLVGGEETPPMNDGESTESELSAEAIWTMAGEKVFGEGVDIRDEDWTLGAK